MVLYFMKLSELIQEQATPFLTDEKEIREWLKVHCSFYDTTAQQYKIRPNGVVDVNEQVEIYVPGKSITEIPIKFGHITGKFDIASNELSDTSFFPESCDTFACEVNLFTQLPNIPKCRRLLAFGNKLTEFPQIPDGIGSVVLRNNPITSLIGVADKMNNMVQYPGKSKCHLKMSFSKIKEGGLGLVLIKGLQLLLDGEADLDGGPFEIINKYLDRPDDIFECQAELIEHGFEEYAKI